MLKQRSFFSLVIILYQLPEMLFATHEIAEKPVIICDDFLIAKFVETQYDEVFSLSTLHNSVYNCVTAQRNLG